MNKYKTMDGNTAVSSVAYKFSELCGIYPITPASPMAENVDVISNSGEVNFWNNKVKVVEMESEAGAIALVHGALQSGVLSSTFTASQGLLLMIPSLYKLAGEMLPAVIHVAARSLSTHALSIFGDHQDVYATRQTGVCILSSSSVESAYHMAVIAHLSAIKSSLPFINFMDGFRTSHEINKIKLMDMEKIKKLIDTEALKRFKDKSMNPSNPTTRGAAENDDIYFQHMESRNNNYINTFNIVSEYMNKINDLMGTNYHPFNYYGCNKPDNVIVAMGSVCETIKETINYLNKLGNKYGLIEVHLYRPFNKDYLKKIIPKTVKNIAVLDRTKEHGSSGEPLYLDVVSALKDTEINIIGGRYGLSSKNTTPSMIKSVFDNLKSKNRISNFTIGITDDVTNLSLKADSNFTIPNDMTEFLIYGYGSDGMVSTSKDILKIIGDNTDNYVQGYFQYDSKKSGGVTRSHIRISNKKISSPYYVDNPSLIVISKDSYIYKYDILDKIKDNGTLILNTNLDKEKLLKTLPNKVKKLLAKKNINLYIIDAYKIVNELGLKNKISTCMEIVIFKIINIMDINKLLELIKASNKKRFASKGDNVIEINNKVVDTALEKLEKVEINKEFINISVDKENELDFDETINMLKGDTLPVSAFLDKKDGIFKGGTTQYEKRDIAENLPCWNSENCIQCNKCVSACPHGVIRPFLLNKDDDKVEGIASLFPKDKKYVLGISYKDCTGCGVCANVCPSKNGKKALTMVKNTHDKSEDTFNYLLENNLNNEYKPKILNVKNTGFIMPNFEFSGACAGCGETAYIKNLTQVFHDNLVIANATGCSSIYGSSVPSMPYKTAWASSLFEDNAEYGLGILNGINIKREKIKNYMEKHCDEELFKLWLDNMDNNEMTTKVRDEIDYNKHPFLKEYKSDIVKNTVWIIGGDGFAYDIGYGGLDHVLSRNDNINILVLDTEVYSNTGGQSSKSSNMGSIASFTSHGKNNYKKDLARIAMCYPHVYVASVNMGYDPEHYLKVLKEANDYNGPSIIIAYSPCIEHGIKLGMEHSLDNAKLAGTCGYFLTFRYSPVDNKFILNSKNVDFDKYNEFLMTENRYANLKKVNPSEADNILENQKQWAINRYNYYKKLDNSEDS